ncbi:heme-degrading domain-containing protein [Konateibacter massiliensis]|uniref:heme-degrading domain-containing protein n=1 Tax=Konateibacter massiliensis TaxID=2002841 RepID=UPI000C15C9CC|nr:heme-binding protein [Konateibacter massiliensis]
MEQLEILEKQEEMLRFKRFDHEEAFKLGNFMVEFAKKKKKTIAVSIRMNSGCIVFQYCPDGTNLLNQKWMERKFNTVKLMERSSLLSALLWEADGTATETHGLKNEEYALCGGGFPIRIEGVSVTVGAVIASNLYHIEDHEYIVDCLREYLSCKDVPAYLYEHP